MFFSPVIKPSEIVSSALAQAAVAPVQQVGIVTVTATASTNYVIKLTGKAYGGLLGANEEINWYGTHTSLASGSTATTIADALVLSLQKAISKAPVPFVTVANTAGAITVTGVAQPYIRTKFEGRQVHFNIEISSPEAQWQGAASGTAVAPSPGRGQYNQVASMEEFYAGYSRGYANRAANFPHDVTPDFAAAAGNTYTADTVTFATIDPRANLGSQRQVITCFFQE